MLPCIGIRTETNSTVRPSKFGVEDIFDFASPDCRDQMKGENVRMRDITLRFIVLFSISLLFPTQKAQAQQQRPEPQPSASATVGGICLVENGCTPNQDLHRLLHLPLLL